VSKKGDKRKQLKTRGRGAPQSASRGALSEYEELYDHKAGTFGGPSLFGAQRFALGGSVSDLSMLDRAAMSVRPRYSQTEKDWIAAREAEYADYNTAVDKYNAGVSDYQKLVDAYNESIKPYQAEYDQYVAAADAHNKAVEAYRQSLFLKGDTPRVYEPVRVARAGWMGDVQDPETGTYYGQNSSPFYATLSDTPDLYIARQAPSETLNVTTKWSGNTANVFDASGNLITSYTRPPGIYVGAVPILGKDYMVDVSGTKMYKFAPEPGEFTAKPPGDPPPAFTGVEPVAPTNVPYTQEQVQQYVDTAKQRAERSASSRALGLKVAADPSQYGLSGLSVGLPFKDGGEVSNAKFIRRRAKGSSDEGEVSNDDYIQQMMTGTPPTDQGSRPYDESALAQFADYLRAPVDLAQTVARGMVGSVVGPAYGVYKGLTGGKYGTPEGVREASEAGGELMQRITGEPKSQAAKDVLEFIGKKAEEYKLAPMPQLMTLPVPGPGALRYPAEAAKTQAEDIALRAVRSQTENPDISAAELYNAMLGKQAPGAAIVKPTGTPTTVQAPQTPLGFYSAVEDTILKLPQEKGTAQQLLAQISKAPGVKTKEVEATGLAEFLRSKGTAPVTKQEIQDFLANNRVQVDEVVLGKGQVMSPEAKQRMGEAENRMIEIDNQLAPYFENLQRPDIDPYGTFVRLRGPVARKAAAGDAEAMAEIDALNLPPNIKQLLLEFGEQKNEYQKYAKQSRRIEKPRFDRYNIPGGENAREIYLTLPPRSVAPTPFDKSPATMLFEREMMEKYGTTDFPSTYNRLSPDEVDKYEMYVREDRNAAKTESILRDRQTNYTVHSSHSVSPEADTNRLAHIFLDDRTDAQGNKTLFVQELQSDWGQEGKKKGFGTKSTPWEDPAYKAARARATDLLNEFNRNNDNPARQAEIRPLLDEATEAERSFQGKSGPPPAPFVTNTEDWLNLALKRVIKEAVDSGADNVAFIKGEQAANKYSLSTVLDNIEVMPFHPLHAFKGRLVDLKRKDGGIIELKVDDKGKVLDVSDSVFFREFANKPLSDIVGKEMSEKIMAVKPGEESVQFSAKDMEVGGQGMKSFYDNIVPKTAKKLLEKLGSKVETIDLGRTKSRETWVQGRENPFRAEQDINEPYEGRVKIVNTETGESRMFDTRDEADEYVAEALGHNVDQIHLGFKITPEMREIVKGQGLPQFAKGGEVSKFIKAHA
jgi:hypothetical protein